MKRSSSNTAGMRGSRIWHVVVVNTMFRWNRIKDGRRINNCVGQTQGAYGHSLHSSEPAAYPQSQCEGGGLAHFLTLCLSISNIIAMMRCLMRLPLFTPTALFLLAILLSEYELECSGTSLFDVLTAENSNRNALGLRSSSTRESSDDDGINLPSTTFNCQCLFVI